MYSLLRAKERGALPTRGVVFVEELVELVEVGGGAAVDVVPPVADEVLLVEHGAVRAEEAVEVAVRLAHVEHLRGEREGKGIFGYSTQCQNDNYTMGFYGNRQCQKVQG